MKLLRLLALVIPLTLPSFARAQYTPPSSGSGSGVGSGASPIVGFYGSNICPGAIGTISGNCAPFYANVQVDNTATWSSSSLTVAATDSPFKASDVTTPAKYIWGFGSTVTGGVHGGCDPYQSVPVAAAMTTTHLTITGFIDANHVTVSADPGTTWSTTGGCIGWGQPDDAAAVALEAAYDAATSCPKVTLAAGYYLFTVPHFLSQPTACLNHPAVFNSSTLGNVYFAAGVDFEGRGNIATTFFIPPDFNGGVCANNGPGADAMWAVPGEGYYHDFGISGLGAIAGSISNCALLEVGVGSLERFLGTNFGAGNSTVWGVHWWNQSQGYQVNVSSFGGTGFRVNASTGTEFAGSPMTLSRCIRCSSDNSTSSDWLIDSGANFQATLSYSFGTQNTAGVTHITNGGGTLWLENVDVTQIAMAAGTNAGTTAYLCNSAGCILHASHVKFGVGSVATIQNGVLCTAACTSYFQDSILNGKGTGSPLNDGVSTSNTYDLGGLQFTGTAISITGKFHHRETGTCTFATSTTCAVTFTSSFGSVSPTFLVPPNITGTATTLTVSALTATTATITASASNSAAVNWEAVLQ
jgi:hypothetical protein